MQKRLGLSVRHERSFYGFQLRVQKPKYGFCLLLKKWCLFCDYVYFSYHIVLHSSNFSVTDFSVSVFGFVRSFEVCYSFVGFVYIYYLIHQSVVVFCLVLFRKSVAQFFSNVYASFVFRGRSAVQFFCICQFQ